jgi:ABC-type multidrug transport system ATPase subunit
MSSLNESPSESAFGVFHLHQVCVRYGRQQAVKEVSLALQKGEALGLLGANGAGKTSTLKALMGMLKPSAGQVSVFGLAPGSVGALARTGFAPEDAVPPERCSGQEYLEFIGRMRRIPDSRLKDECASLLSDFDLVPHKRVKTYSKGMKRRLVLAQAFLGTPEFLVLDEPLNGLDPLVIVKLRERIEKYRSAGGSLLYSSHILSEIEKSCTRIAVLREGELVLNCPTSEAVKQYGSVEAAFEAVAGRKA